MGNLKKIKNVVILTIIFISALLFLNVNKPAQAYIPSDCHSLCSTCETKTCIVSDGNGNVTTCPKEYSAECQE